MIKSLQLYFLLFQTEPAFLSIPTTLNCVSLIVILPPSFISKNSTGFAPITQYLEPLLKKRPLPISIVWYKLSFSMPYIWVNVDSSQCSTFPPLNIWRLFVFWNASENHREIERKITTLWTLSTKKGRLLAASRLQQVFQQIDNWVYNFFNWRSNHLDNIILFWSIGWSCV